MSEGITQKPGCYIAPTLVQASDVTINMEAICGPGALLGSPGTMEIWTLLRRPPGHKSNQYTLAEGSQFTPLKTDPSAQS